MSDDSNNVHFSGIRFICSPYLAIKSAIASLGPVMSRCGLEMNLNVLKMNIIVIYDQSVRSLRVRSPYRYRFCHVDLML